LVASTTICSGEEESTPIMDKQHTGDNSPSVWGDRDEQELPDYEEVIYWEFNPDSEDPDTEV